MNPGKSQNDIVSGEAKLSSILRGVRVVASRISSNGWAGSSAAQRMPFSISQSPLSSRAVCASMREMNWVESLKKKSVTGSRTSCCEAILPAWIMI